MFYEKEKRKNLLGVFVLFILMKVIEVSHWLSAITDIALAFVCLLGILKLFIKRHRWSEIWLTIVSLITAIAISFFQKRREGKSFYEKSIYAEQR